VTVQALLTAAQRNPWGALRLLLDGPLHPGGGEATDALLDRAGVTRGTRLLDVGCGAGDALARARDRGADAVGLDSQPAADAPRATTLRGDLSRPPVRDGSADVVLAECVLCRADDPAVALEEAHRVLADGGRLALSDVVLDGELPALPATLERTLCLTGDRRRERLFAAVEAAGFTVDDRREHPEDLLAMRDRVADRVDYERLLGSFGERGERLLAAVEELEAAVEDGRLGYVSAVAVAD
jgi:arsenite methyltransferase